ncbi:uncharacterized protein LODBEIA_P57730 [Lodderomyces beijingensis]|uniref:ATP-dependent RNA helicase n=1 Tax=Lodderomyces beijingensis TaxID=1775926 RepID=A0ABP0ZTS0_9ASCO
MSNNGYNNNDDDDDMMLNFATPVASHPATITTKSDLSVRVSGGRWKDRRRLQLALSGRTKEKSKPTPKGPNSTPIDVEKAQKRKFNHSEREKPKKSSSSMSSSSSQNDSSAYKRPKVAEKGSHGAKKDDSHVSSLFTNNVVSSQLGTTKKETGEGKEEQEKTYAASNAPVKGASTFAGLGLNDRLSAQLLDHLRFKYPTQIQKSVVPELLTSQNDLFVKAQTGSGKTMAFVLPIFHKLMVEEKHRIGRDSGVFAIILTPTRELANQIYSVLENLNRCCPFIVPGIVIGGEKKKSEKARIRKGINILVATPGRLADHLENTKSLDIGQLRYLVLDEGDKLVELGFEETITKITKLIDDRSDIASTTQKWQGLPTRRINILCSATLQNNVEKLGSIILDHPKMIAVDREVEGTVLFSDDHDNYDGDGNALATPSSSNTNGATNQHESFAPEQLVQNVVIVPPKLRLVSLNASLTNVAREIGESQPGHPSRSMVFFSCSDSVNYHFELFTRDGKTFKKIKDAETGKSTSILVDKEDAMDEEDDIDIAEITAPLIHENTLIYKLHGSLSQQTRTNILKNFVKDDARFPHKVLFCTDVASRGLDLPNISNVIEFDAPFTVDDHLHRVGRSARVGNQGTATLYLTPGLEEGYIDAKLKVVHPRKGGIRLLNYEKALQQAFAEKDALGKKNKHNKVGNWDVHATTWHLEVERWLLEDSDALAKASQAFTSHIRAYATHLSTERNFFNVKLLHLGHLAKSFGLRETPKSLGRKSGKVNDNTHGGETRRSTKKEDPRKKMLRMAKMAVKSASSEFNY